MRVISVVGARPQFVKLAPIVKAAKQAGVDHATVHTGQHYDDAMSGVFFDELGIGEPEWNLEVGSASHGAQTGAMLAKLDELFNRERPDWVLVYGDTNSTVAGALAAVKLHVPLAHLEAGLRSFNRAMPEEHNRVLTDHAADLLLAPTEVAARHLANEGLAERTRVVGDVMIDVLLEASVQPVDPALSARLPNEPFVLATIHRAENTDDPARLAAVIDALGSIDVPVVLPRHPRLRDRCAAAGISLEVGNLHPVEPLSYVEMVQATRGSVAVATDSGGLQKEAFVLGRPVTTLRTETEWVETLTGGWNVLLPGLIDISAVVLRDLPEAERGAPYGDGDAAGRALQALADASALR